MLKNNLPDEKINKTKKIKKYNFLNNNKYFPHVIKYWKNMVYLNTENTRAILPIALILFLMTSLRALPAPPETKGGKLIKRLI